MTRSSEYQSNARFDNVVFDFDLTQQDNEETVNMVDTSTSQPLTDQHDHGSTQKHRLTALAIVVFALVASLGAVAFHVGTAPEKETPSELSTKSENVQNVTPAARAAAAARTARVANVGRVARVAHAADAARASLGLLGLTVAGSIIASKRYRRQGGAEDHEDHDIEPHAFAGWRVSWFDTLGVKVPNALGLYSPLLWNISSDATYLRAMVGPLSLILPLLGIGLGVASSMEVHQAFAVPSVGLFTAVLVLGIFDGLAGVLAMFMLFGGALIAGNLSWLDTPIFLLIVGSLWFGLSQVVRKVRSFTRPSPHGLHQWWQRVGDLIIGPALGGYLAKSITEVLPGTVHSGESAASHAALIGFIATACILVRYGFEFSASHHFSHDLVIFHEFEAPKQSHSFQIVAHVVEITLILMLFVVFLGPVWLAVPLLVFFALDLVIVELIPPKRLPTWVYRAVPRNVGKILFISLIVVFLESIIAIYVESELLRIGYLLVGITAIGVIHTWLGAADGEDFPENSMRKVGGVILVTLAALQLGGLLL